MSSRRGAAGNGVGHVSLLTTTVEECEKNTGITLWAHSNKYTGRQNNVYTHQEKKNLQKYLIRISTSIHIDT